MRGTQPTLTPNPLLQVFSVMNVLHHSEKRVKGELQQGVPSCFPLEKPKRAAAIFFFALRTPAELAAVLCMHMEGCARGGCFFMCISPPVHCPWPWAQPRRLRSRPCFGLHQDIVLLQRASNWLMVPWPLLRNADHPISASNRHTRKPVTFDESGDGMASTTSRGREEEEGKKEGVVRGGGGARIGANGEQQQWSQ